MKKWVMVVFTMFVFSSVAVRAEVGGVALVQNVSTKEASNGYFLLSDGSYWKVMSFVARTRGLSEWWNDVQLAPEAYKCKPKDWARGAEIIAYPKYGNIGADESNASNQKDIKQCSYLLVNQANGQTLFAMPLDAAQCLQLVHSDSYQNGYDQGYLRAYVERSSISQSAFEENYKKGYAEGHEVGYTKGYQKGSKDTQEGKASTSGTSQRRCRNYD